MVVVANFAPGPFPAFLREHVLLLIQKMLKEQSIQGLLPGVWTPILSANTIPEGRPALRIVGCQIELMSHSQVNINTELSSRSAKN